MLVVYGWKQYLVVDKDSSEVIECPNCGHNTKLSMAKEKIKLNIFYIPFFVKTMRYVKVCPNCGAIQKYKASEYKEELAKMR